MDYELWKNELEKYTILNYGSIDEVKNYDSVKQRAMDNHMTEYAMSFCNNDLMKRMELIKELRTYMHIYTKNLRK